MKLLSLTLFILLCHTVVYAQPCSMIEKYGIYDTRTLSISKERAISYLNFLKKDSKMTFEDAKDYTTSIGIPIEGVMTSLGFSATEYGYRQFIESVVNMTTYNEIYLEKIVSISRLINADILKILDECYKLPGIYSRVESSEDPSLYFLVIDFRWEGNHDAVPVDIIVTDRNSITIDGATVPSGKKSFTVHNGEERRLAIKQTKNNTIGFSVRVRRQVTGGTVTVRSGNLAIYKSQATPTNPTRQYKVERIATRTLPRSSTARWISGGDEELKRFETTEFSGTFNLGIDGRNLTGNVMATYVEKVSNNTAFETKQSFTLYTAPEGWRIAGYGIENEPYGSSTSNFGPLIQSSWVSPPLYTSGPVQYFVWQGDTGRDQDEIDGCWIQVALKDIVVLLEKV